MDRINKKAVAGCLLALSTSAAYSGAMGPVTIEPTSRIYLGVFGGGGAVSSTDISQYGTAFLFENLGGALAVNSFGKANSSSMGMVGGHIGFAWPNHVGVHLPITPAIELEGYYIGGAKLKGHDINNETIRLPEHDFFVRYPLKTGVALVNAVLNVDHSLFGNVKPYVGVGIGSAVVSISGASSVQLSPAEPGLNHYNADPDDKAVAFAVQPKVGLRYDFSSQASFFAEYRFLYLSETNYTFGSTIQTGHPVTAPWLVKIKPQYYNMGTVGIDFDL
ncbi:porin family protein [Legionella tunisiensis]|uniref:outer membrane beta-barrel protein n=1 Tax=Legionella tunisiensis TaxID=1034944 RepID=UPI00030E17BA|nr:outer membrane beta-barrel protein [Legionella tunisiensis]